MNLGEERTANIQRLEVLGFLDPSCPKCREQYEYYSNKWQPGDGGPFAPSHKSSVFCESGKRPHCTCPICWG